MIIIKQIGDPPFLPIFIILIIKKVFLTDNLLKTTYRPVCYTIPNSCGRLTVEIQFLKKNI